MVFGKCIPNRGLTLVIAIRWLQACFVCLIDLSKNAPMFQSQSNFIDSVAMVDSVSTTES